MPQPRSSTVSMQFENEAPVCSAAYLHEPVMALAQGFERARVLDVGCGNGYWARLFHDRGCQVVGIDPSTSGIEIARRACPGGRFECLEAGPDILSDLGEPPFDLVVSTEVVEHLYDPPTYAEGCFNALRPGGRMIVSTPYHGWLKNVALAVTGKLDPHHEALRVGGHIKFFSRRTLEQLLADAGFRDLRFVGSGRVPLMWKSMVIGATRP